MLDNTRHLWTAAIYQDKTGNYWFRVHCKNYSSELFESFSECAQKARDWMRMEGAIFVTTERMGLLEWQESEHKGEVIKIKSSPWECPRCGDQREPIAGFDGQAKCHACHYKENSRVFEIGKPLANADAASDSREKIQQVREYLESIRGKNYGRLVVQCWPKTLLCVSVDGSVTGIRDADKRELADWAGADLYSNEEGESATLMPAELIRQAVVTQTTRVLNDFERMLAIAEGGQLN